MSLQDVVKACGLGSSFAVEACGVWVSTWVSGKRRCVPSVTHSTLCTGTTVWTGRLFDVRCRPLQIEKHLGVGGGGGVLAWLQTTNWREMNFC